MYDIGRDGDVVSLSYESISASRLVILGKHTYFETVEAFPFGNIKEIKAAIAMDPGSYAPFSTELFFLRRIGHKDDKTLVNLWFIRPEIVAELDLMSPWLIFPETALWCMGILSERGLHVISHPVGYLLVYLQENGGIHSTLAENDDADMEAFQRSIGQDVSRSEVFRTDDFEYYLSRLRDAISSISLSDVVCFFRPRFRSTDIDIKLLKRSLVSLGLILSIYIGTWAAMPVYVNNKLIKENETVSAGLGDILDKQVRTDEMMKDIDLMMQAMKDYTPRMALLNLLYSSMPSDTIITQMTVAGNKVEIRGSSDQASVVLGSLSAGQGVEQAQFSAPLRKDAKTNREQFVLTFIFRLPVPPKSS